MEKEPKYNIKKLIEALPRSVNPAIELAKSGISRSTFYRDQSITKQSSQTISGDRLQIYAQYFNVTMEQLFKAPLKVKAKAKVKSGLK